MFPIVFLLIVLLQTITHKSEPVIFARQQPVVAQIVETKHATQSVKFEEDKIIIKAATPKPTPTKKPTPVLPTPADKPQKAIVTTGSESSLSNELTQAVNTYRSTHGKASLHVHQLLCSVASKRVSELIQRGSLDGHEGFHKYTEQIKQQFNKWWETIFYGSKSISPRDVVTIYWDGSQGHKEALLSDATHGCGFVNSGYAVYVLGRK
jgi:uncharacterized protein YkwD